LIGEKRNGNREIETQIPEEAEVGNPENDEAAEAAADERKREAAE
jgi:hypothetical protein